MQNKPQGKMMKNFIGKIIDSVLCFSVAMTAMTNFAYAETIKGDAEDSSAMWYWQENFNDYTEGSYSYDTGEKPDCITIPNTHRDVYIQSAKVADNDYALEIKGDKLASNQQVKIVTDKCNFEKGPVTVQLDATFAAAPQGFRMDLCDSETTTPIGNIFQAKSNRWWAYPAATWNAATTQTIETGKKYSFTASLVYDRDNDKITVKTYVDGQRLVRNDGSNTPIEYDITGKSAVLGNTLVLRFYAYKNDDVIIDNVTVRNEGSIDLPDFVQTENGSAHIDITDTAEYGDIISYPNAAFGLNSETYSLIQYQAADNPFLIGGAKANCAIDTSHNKKLVINNLDSESVYVFKLTDESAVTAFFGEPVSNRETLIAGADYTDSGIRGTVLYDENGEEISLTENGSFPESARKIVIGTKEGTTFADVHAVLGDKTVTAEPEENSYVINIDGDYLANAETIVITADSVSKEYAVSGERPSDRLAQCFTEAFDGDELPAALKNSAPSYITVSLKDGRLKYENTFTGGTKNLTYDFGKKINFSVGSLLVSFDVTLNQAISWIGTSGASYFLYPHVETGTRNIGQTPLIEHDGLRRATTTESLRDTIGLEGATATVGKTYTLRALYTYDSDKKSMSVLQFIGDNEMTTKSGVLAGANVYNNITKEDLDGTLKLVFAGRNFKDGGLYIDNISFTMVGDISADNLIEIENDVATIAVRQNLEFAEGSDEELTRVRYTNNVKKEDITVYRYAVSDTLMTNGEAVTDFKYFREPFTISKLTDKERYNYVIDIGDPGKVASWNKKTLDHRYYKAGSNPGGLIKVLKYDANGNLMEELNGGKWQSDLTKVRLLFADGYASDSVSLNGIAAQPSSDNTEWEFDFSDSPLEENKEYVLSVDGEEYGRVTTDGGKLSAAKPEINSDGSGSVHIINTTADDKNAYLVSSFSNENGELISARYKKLLVPKNSANTYSMPAAEVSDAALLQMYVIDSFETMNLLGECAQRNISDITPIEYDATTAIVMKPMDSSCRSAITATLEKNKTVSVAVFANGMSFSDADNGTENALALSGVCSADDNGKLSVPVNMTGFPKGIYSVRVCMDGKVIFEKKLSVSHSDDYAELIPQLNNVLANGSTDEIISFLNANATALRLEKNYDISEKSDNQTAEILKSNAPYSETDPSAIEAVADTYYSAVFVGALTERKETDMVKFADNFDMFRESPLKDIYSMKYITDSVKSNVIDRVAGGGAYKSLDALKAVTADSFILAVINNPTGPGDIKDVILKVYPNFNEKYLTTERCRSIQNKNYTSFSEAEKALAEYKSSSSSGGGSSSGGIKPSFTPSASGGKGNGAAGGTTGAATDNNKTQQYDYFTDLDSSAWAKTAINSLCKKGVIAGRSKDTFAPESEITREEFVKLLVVLFKLSETDDKPLPFTDVAENQWFYPYIKTAYAAGITGGISDELFGAGTFITRQDAAVMLERCISSYQLEEQDKEPFADISSVSDYAQQAVSLIQRLGIINGYDDGTFKPERYITRAEAAVILYETDERIESI